MSESPKKGFGERSEITRRDFLDGMAIGAAGLAAAAAAPYLTGAEAALVERGGARPLPADYYPPRQTGIVGHRDGLVRKTVKIDGPPNPDKEHSAKPGPGIDRRVADTGQVYDCVIVGAGISGLAAAKYYGDRFGANSKILLLDPMRDFGGHAHRNEFHVPNAAAGGTDVTILRNGGTFNLDSIGSWNLPAGSPAVGYDIPGSYGQPSRDLLDFLGIDVENFPETISNSIPDAYGLRFTNLFASEAFGADTVVEDQGETESYADFFARTPFSPRARADLVRLYEQTGRDWIGERDGPLSDARKKALLARITYKAYLNDYIGVTDEAALWLQRNPHSLYGAGIQAVQAGDLYLLGEPGFEGLGLEYGDFPGVGRTAQMNANPAAPPSHLWPDGNASLARLLVSSLIPKAFPDVDGARPNYVNIVKAPCRYSELDRKSNDVRIRLNSTVINVVPARRRGLSEIDYVNAGKGKRVRARHVVMACWNRVTAHLVEDLPERQVANLCYARKVPLIYGRASLNNWQAFADAKIRSVNPVGNSLFWDSTSVSAGASFGDSYGPTPAEPPSAPAVLNFTCVPTDPSRETQLSAYEAGKQMMLEMSFEDLEGALIDVIDRSVNRSGGDFDPERDINEIMINRWNYGYAYELTSTFDPSLFGPNDAQPHVKGRKPYRNVSIANSDSGAFAYSHSAINEAYRAVNDLP